MFANRRAEAELSASRRKCRRYERVSTLRRQRQTSTDVNFVGGRRQRDITVRGSYARRLLDLQHRMYDRL